MSERVQSESQSCGMLLRAIVAWHGCDILDTPLKCPCIPSHLCGSAMFLSCIDTEHHEANETQSIADILTSCYPTTTNKNEFCSAVVMYAVLSVLMQPPFASERDVSVCI